MTITDPKILLLTRNWGREAGFNIELAKCITEYCGISSLTNLELENTESITSALIRATKDTNFDFLIIDARCCVIDARFPQLHTHLQDARQINLICRQKNIVPICILTDPLFPGFSLLADLLTYRSGLVVPITAEVPFSKFIFRQSSIPVGTPISIETFTELESTRHDSKHDFDLYLGGSTYEPRKSYFDKVNKILSKTEIRIQQTPKKADNYKDYLMDLRKSKMVLSTNFLQLPESKKTHLLGKSIETLHVGSLLLTQSTPELTHNFTENIDFIPVESPKDAAEKILHFNFYEEERLRISESGFSKAKKLVMRSYFISEIDHALTSNRLPKLRK